jgi:hypothetical protein
MKDTAMSAQDTAIAKLQRLPEPLAREVNDFIDFLLLKQDADRWQMWTHFNESRSLAEAGMDDYARNLDDYEERLARGEIRW